jgi:signal transduction histidine kinase/streptogramin lyase
VSATRPRDQIVAGPPTAIWGRSGLVAVFVVWLAAGAALAAAAKLDASGGYAIRWWTVEDGLAATPLVGVAVAADDAVWSASRSDLMRFDGRQFALLPEPVAAWLQSVIGEFRGLGFAPDGRLWLVGTTGAAVARPPAALDRSTPDDWAAYPHAGGELWGLTFSPSGQPLFVGKNLLATCDGTRLVPHPLSGTIPEFVYYAAAFDGRSADLWVYGYGRARRVREGVARVADGPIARRIINLAAGDSGLWAGLVDADSQTVEGAAVFHDEAWHEYPMATKPATAAREGHICEGPDGTVWLATHASMHALRDGTWQTILTGLPGFSLTTHRLATDRRGGLWAACTGGLLNISETSLAASPLPPCGVVVRRHDGSLAAGIAGAVVRLVPPAGDPLDDKPAAQWGHEPIAELPAGVTPTAIAETPDGRLFVGTRDSFIHVVEPGSTRMLTQPRTLPLEVRNVNALACDAAGTVWAGTMNGLARYIPERDRFEFLDASITPTPLPVLGLFAEPDGSLLVAVQGRGIERLAADGSVVEVVPAAQMPGRRTVRFLRTADGTLWAAGDGGLLRRAAAGQTTLLDTRHGLAERAIVQLAADDSGRLWLAFRDGHLQGIRLADLAAFAAGLRSVVRGIVLGPLDGLGETELLGGLAFAPGHGLLATTAAGIVAVDPARLAAAGGAPGSRITIDHAERDNQSLFRWADVTTHDFEPPLYQTRLAGVDAAWSPPASDTSRSYAAAAIPPGRHRFEVRRLRGDAVEEAPAAAIEIVVAAAFWQTPWFLAAAAAGVAGLAAAGGMVASRAVARRRIAQFEREQERQRDRARIARDIHDSLGAGLAQMAMLSDVMRSGSRGGPPAAGGGQPQLDEALDEMFKSAQSLTRAVDEIVWAVNPTNDTLHRLFSFLAHDVEELARSGGLALTIRVDDDGPDATLSSTTRHHLCMLVREAVANVLKHAQATALDVAVEHHAAAVRIVIADDGVGFDPSRPAADGHDGLGNMRARLDELGGSLTIDSAPGRGTRVAVQVPLAAAAPRSAGRLRLRPKSAASGTWNEPDDARRIG